MGERLKGKIAIVTGAGSIGPGWGNGRASAVRFAQEGAQVFAVDRDLASVRETIERAGEAGGALHPHQCDMTDTKAVAAMAAACVTKFGRVDILMNNVGGSAHGGPVDLPEEVWQQQIAVNLTSVYLGCKHVIPVMEKNGGGSIINVASTSGIRWTGSAQVGYAATKGGVIQLSRVVAVEFAGKGIRVNSIVPGQLHTPMVEARLAKQRAGGDVEKLLQQRLKRIPMGFAGDGRDTANVALFLASDESRWVTGTEIVVDGGMSARCD